MNRTAHARLIRDALPYLWASGEGGVANIASTEAIVTTVGMAPYAATKAGVLGLTRSFAVEFGHTGVTVNAICPEPISTGMTDPFPKRPRRPTLTGGCPRAATASRKRSPMPRFRWSCRPRVSINGATLVVDGGMSIRHT